MGRHVGSGSYHRDIIGLLHFTLIRLICRACEERLLFSELASHLVGMAQFKVNTGLRQQEVVNWEWESCRGQHPVADRVCVNAEDSRG
jgi:hypothetical protein